MSSTDSWTIPRHFVLRYCLCVALTLGIWLIPPISGHAATVGAEYANTDACGNATLPNADNNANDFVSVMQSFGHTRRFVYGNSLFWPEDLVDNSVPSGLDDWIGDRPNILFLESHGGSSSARFRITTGVTHTVDGVSTCRSYTSNPNTGTQWWKMGDDNLRILSMLTCHGLELSDLPHWNAVANGIHMITGGSGNMYDSSSTGFNYAFWGNLGLTVKQAWFNAASADVTVVMAYGVDRDDAINRRDHEKFSWSMARLGTRTWRAWSWID